MSRKMKLQPVSGPLIRQHPNFFHRESVIFQQDIPDIGCIVNTSLKIRTRKLILNNMTMSLNNKVTKIQAGLERIMISASDRDTPEWFLQKLHQLHEQMGQNFKLVSSESITREM